MSSLKSPSLTAARGAEYHKIPIPAAKLSPALMVPFRSDMRCASCRPVGSKFLHTSSFTYLSLKLSASRGCPLCRFLFVEVAAQSRHQSQDQSRNLRFCMTSDMHQMTLVDFAATSWVFEIYRTTGKNTSGQFTESLSSLIKVEVQKSVMARFKPLNIARSADTVH